jgi:hypothetical protein
MIYTFFYVEMLDVFLCFDYYSTNILFKVNEIVKK